MTQKTVLFCLKSFLRFVGFFHEIVVEKMGLALNIQ